MINNNTDDIVFVDANLVSRTVKDIAPIEVFESGVDYSLQNGDFIDDVATRVEHYGDGAEGLSYAIVEHNIVAFVEADFDVSRLKKINIPVVT